jgi:hypothetical protein
VIGARIPLGLAVGYEVSITLSGVPAAMYYGHDATVSGTCTPLTATVTVTVNGIAFGSAVASGGSWSITEPVPLGAIGEWVPVVATIGGYSVESTTSVRDVTLISVPSIMVVGVNDTVYGNRYPSNSVVSVTVDGEAFATDSSTDEYWSVMAAATDAMIGAGVAVVASIDSGSDTATDTTDVKLVAIDTFDDPMSAGVSTTISGRVKPNETVTVTINGEAFGSDSTTSEGTWSVTADPTSAMGGEDVDVVASVTAGSDTVTADVYSVAITGIDDALFNGVSTTISGTCTPPTATVTVTIDGESFGSDVASGGAWSVTAEPSAAMVGDVNVVASAGATSDTVATSVLDPLILLRRGEDVSVDGSNNISTWGDLGDMSNDVTQGTEAARPASVTNGADFTPNDSLQNSTVGNDIGNAKSNLYAIITFKSDTTAGVYYGLLNVGNYSNNWGEVAVDVSSNTLNWRFNTNSQTYATAFTDTASYHVAEIHYVSGNADLYLDGTRVKDDLVVSSLDCSGLKLVIGSVYGDGTGNFNGVISDVFMDVRGLSATSRAAAYSYFNSRKP